MGPLYQSSTSSLFRHPSEKNIVNQYSAIELAIYCNMTNDYHNQFGNKKTLQHNDLFPFGPDCCNTTIEFYLCLVINKANSKY